jgi:hypothetical protein
MTNPTNKFQTPHVISRSPPRSIMLETPYHDIILRESLLPVRVLRTLLHLFS